MRMVKNTRDIIPFPASSETLNVTAVSLEALLQCSGEIVRQTLPPTAQSREYEPLFMRVDSATFETGSPMYILALGSER